MRQFFFACLALMAATAAKADVVLKFSNSDTTFNEITTFSITVGSSGASASNRIYLFAEDSTFSANNGLGGFAVSIGSAGAIANVGASTNLFINGGFPNQIKTYSSETGYIEGSTNSGGIAATANRVYLGYFGLDGISEGGPTNLTVTANTNPGFWFYGNNNLATVDPSSSTISITVAPVPEPGTLCLGAFAAVSAGGTWFARRKKATAQTI